MATTQNKILLTRDGAIASVSLNKPERLNALDKDMWRQLGEIFTALDADERLRAVILRGAGERAFAAGADIAAFPTERANIAQAQAYGSVVQGAMDAVSRCRHPVIAMIHGVCVGGGLELAAACDLRICGASSRFGVPVKNLGLVVAYGELQTLIGVVGRAIALEIVLEGRVFGAQEALEKRLVNRVVLDEKVAEEALAAARRIAEGAPLAARWHKKFARRLADPQPLTDAEHDESYACFGTEDYEIGYRAFLAKARPEFRGR